jgi:hypothetical protein
MALVSLSFALLACAGNPYGYAPEYVPLSDEEEYFEKGQMQSYEDVRRDPSSYGNAMITWFGIVEGVQPVGSNGEARIAMNLRFHQERHLCTDQFDSSCRVTISEKEGGPFSALVTLRSEDREGKDRVYAGSLIRVYGSAVPDYDDRGGPVIKALYYRHWPRATYVTTGRRVNMRR